MMFDELRALDLASRPGKRGVAAGNLRYVYGGHQGLVVGRPRSACPGHDGRLCLTNFQSLIDAGGLSKHGVYYFIPGLLKHFDTFQINQLIVPRAHLSVNGRRDDLTPPAGVEQVRDQRCLCTGLMGRPRLPHRTLRLRSRGVAGNAARDSCLDGSTPGCLGPPEGNEYLLSRLATRPVGSGLPNS